jgi:hypothetical protein
VLPKQKISHSQKCYQNKRHHSAKNATRTKDITGPKLLPNDITQPKLLPKQKISHSQKCYQNKRYHTTKTATITKDITQLKLLPKNITQPKLVPNDITQLKLLPKQKISHSQNCYQNKRYHTAKTATKTKDIAQLKQLPKISHS